MLWLTDKTRHFIKNSDAIGSKKRRLRSILWLFFKKDKFCVSVVGFMGQFFSFILL